MTEHPQQVPPPEWVHKRDGRLVPFEAAKISRALFAATESLGRPDPFLAHELTEGVLHFLAVETDETIPTTTHVAEMLVKVVRELGQPALAGAFADCERKRGQSEPRSAKKERQRPSAAETWDVPSSFFHGRSSLLDPPSLLRRAGAACLRTYALREVFARDLVAAQQSGLLTLHGLEAPFELAGWLLGPPARLRLVEAVEEARGIAGEFLAIDGPEHYLASGGLTRGAEDYVRELGIGARSTGLKAVVNLNSSVPPSWAGDLADGPLFAERGRKPPPNSAASLADELLSLLFESESLRDRVRVDWHLGERDFASPEPARLAQLARRALEGNPLTFAFDRGRQPLALAEGIDRRHPAVLMSVELHLPALAEQLGQRISSGDVRQARKLFLEKLGVLARLALSAGVQKRDFLRRQNRTWPAFLLDRARLVAVPTGLEAVSRKFAGEEPGGKGAGLEFARQVVQRLEEVLARDGQASRLDTCLDGPGVETRSQESAPGEIGALTPWDPQASCKEKVKAPAMQHAAHGLGTVVIAVPDERLPAAEEVVELLHRTWRHADVARLRFVRAGQSRQQLMAPWEMTNDE